MIKNFDKLIEIYNAWAEQNSDLCCPVDSELPAAKIVKESNFWHDIISTTQITEK